MPCNFPETDGIFLYSVSCFRKYSVKWEGKKPWRVKVGRIERMWSDSASVKYW